MEGGTSGVNQGVENDVQEASFIMNDKGGPSDQICMGTNARNNKLTRNITNVDGGTSNLVCLDTNFSNENDAAVRIWARRIISKDLEILKACKVVVEQYQKLPDIDPKITNWNENFERTWNLEDSEWKVPQPERNLSAKNCKRE